MKNKGCSLCKMIRDIYINLQKLTKTDLKTPKIYSTIRHFFFSSVLIDAMATRHMCLQSSLFLNHEIQGLLFMNDDKRYLYQSTKVAINWLQNS